MEVYIDCKNKLDYYNVEQILGSFGFKVCRVSGLETKIDNPGLSDEWHMVSTLNIAIFEVAGVSSDVYRSATRKREAFYARMLFVKHSRDMGLTHKWIGSYINRDHSSVIYIYNKYADEYRYNPFFRELADKTAERLKLLL